MPERIVTKPFVHQKLATVAAPCRQLRTMSTVAQPLARRASRRRMVLQAIQGPLHSHSEKSSFGVVRPSALLLRSGNWRDSLMRAIAWQRTDTWPRQRSASSTLARQLHGLWLWRYLARATVPSGRPVTTGRIAHPR